MSVSDTIVSPEYTEITYMDKDTNKEVKKFVETYCNQSVKKVVEHMAEKGKEMFGAVNNAVGYIFSTIQEMKNDPRSFIRTKAQTIFANTLTSVDSAMIYFIRQVQNDYEKILNGDYNSFDKYAIYQLASYLGFWFDNSVFYKTGTTDTFDNPATWFKKQFSLYNPGVNFEHVCFAIDLMLNRKAALHETALYAFAFLFKLWMEHRDVMRFVIYHCVKLIRVYYLGVQSESQTNFNPSNKFINLTFGSFIDSNIEIYGDNKITDKQDNVLSLFSYTPRTIVDSDDRKLLFFNWNDGSAPIINMFSHNLIETRLKWEEGYYWGKNLTRIFEYMTNIDIIPRKKNSQARIRNIYNTVVIDDENKDQIKIVYPLIAKMFENIDQKKVYDDALTKHFETYTVYVTYTNTKNKVKTISTELPLKAILTVDLEYNEIIEAARRQQYIPRVHGRFYKATREVFIKEKTPEKFEYHANKTPNTNEELLFKINPHKYGKPNQRHKRNTQEKPKSDRIIKTDY